MGTSIYKGESSRYVMPSPPGQASAPMQIFVGHVLETIYEDPTPGQIKVRLITIDRKNDDSISRTALPADMNMVKYPLPGELVILFNGIGSSTIKDLSLIHI